MTEEAEINAEEKLKPVGEDMHISRLNLSLDAKGKQFEPESVLANLAVNELTDPKCDRAATLSGAGNRIDLNENIIKNAAFGTQGDVIFNYFGNQPDTQHKQSPDPTEQTLKQIEDIPELDDYSQLAEVEGLLFNKRIVIIEQDAENHLLVSNIVRKLRYKWQSQYQMRDAQGVVDITLYSKQCRYLQPTICTLMTQADGSSLLPLLYQDEYDRIRQRLVDNSNHLLIITQLNITQLKKKVVPPVESDLHVWHPEEIATWLQSEALRVSLEQEVDTLFQSDLKIQTFIVFLLGFFPGLSLEHFNGVIRVWLDKNPELKEEPKSSGNEDDNNSQNKSIKRTYNWNTEGDRFIRDSHGVFMEDNGWGKGYYYRSPHYTQNLAQLLIARYPNYCLQHFIELLPLYLQSADTWNRFHEHYRNVFIKLLTHELLCIDQYWLINLYDQQRSRPDRRGLGRFISLLRALSVDYRQSATLVYTFHLTTADILIAKQSTWRNQIEKNARYSSDALGEFQQEIADYISTITGSCGIAEEYMAPILLRFLEHSLYPFSSPLNCPDNDDLEIMICPLSWYAKYQLNLTLFRDHADYFAIIKQMMKFREGKIDGKSPLAIRSGLFLCYFVAVKAFECEADLRLKPKKVGDADSGGLPAVIHELLEHTYNAEIFIRLVVKQLNIVRDVSSLGVYEKWLTHQMILLENIVLIALTSSDWDEAIYLAGLKSLCKLLLQRLSKEEARNIRMQNQQRLLTLQDRYHDTVDYDVNSQQAALKQRLLAAKALRSYLKI